MSDLDVQNINSKTGNAAISIADDGATTVGSFTSTGIDDNATTTQLTVSDAGATASTAFKIGLWEIKLDTNDLRFVYNGTDVARITTAGEIIALDDVTGFGAP